MCLWHTVGNPLEKTDVVLDLLRPPNGAHEV